jgi:hypothetical protein
VQIFGGLIDFTKEPQLEKKTVLMHALREGGRFINLFLTPKSEKLLVRMFLQEKGQVSESFFDCCCNENKYMHLPYS